MYDKAISYSGLSLYKRCPAAWRDAYIDGNRSEAGPAAQRGTELHLQLELFFGGAAYPMTRELLPWSGLMYERKDMGAIAEKSVAVDIDWRPVDFDAPEAYFRGKIDLAYTQDGVSVIEDFKTGRLYPEHGAQGQAYLTLSPEAELTRVSMIYLDQYPLIKSWAYNPADREAHIELLRWQIEKLRSDDDYVATPSMDACRWCPLSWRKGGSCKRAP